MKYLYSKYLQFTEAKVTLPLIVGTTILSSLIGQPVRAAQITFSFDPDADNSDPSIVNDWNHGSGAQDGWQNGNNTGTAIDSSTGLQITFTGAPQNSNNGSNNLVGTARTNSKNFTSDDENLTTIGLKVENINYTDDGNVATLNETDNIRELVDGTLANYQLLTFSFSEPIVIDSDTRFFIDDIDDGSNTGAETYIDALAVEAFTTPNVGTPGTGIDPNFSFETGTELTTGTIDFANSNDVSYVYDFVNSSVNPKNQLQSRAYYDFGTQEVQSIALYYFNGVPNSSTTSGTSGHAVVFGGSFDVQPAATAVPFEFSPDLGFLLSGSSLLGIKYLKRRKLQK